MEEQLAAGREAERLLEAIGLEAESIEQQLDFQSRPSKRLKTLQSVSEGRHTADRVQKLLQFLVGTKFRLEQERDSLMQPQPTLQVSVS